MVRKKKKSSDTNDVHYPKTFYNNILSDIIIIIYSENVKHYFGFLGTRYDVYLNRCPFCGNQRLIRWGYYQRQAQPLHSAVRIQRVRCKKCRRTTNVLPSFLLVDKRYAADALKQLVNIYLSHPTDWTRQLPPLLDLSTAYRWLRMFLRQANASLPDVRKALLLLNPDDSLELQITGKPPPQSTRHSTIARFIACANQLVLAALRLVELKPPLPTDAFCFLNYFLATFSGKALLQQ